MRARELELKSQLPRQANETSPEGNWKRVKSCEVATGKAAEGGTGQGEKNIIKGGARQHPASGEEAGDCGRQARHPQA